MVRSHSIGVSLVVLSLAIMIVSAASAWSGSYHLGQEWVKIWINTDGTIDLFYNISITLDYGDPINFVEVGQPNGDFTIGSALDQFGNNLSTSDTSSSGNYKVCVNLSPPLTEGKTVWFTLITNVAHMIYEDTTNPGNVGMKFIPMWWPQAGVSDLRVLIVLPQNVTQDQVKTLTGVPWNGTQPDVKGQAVYFQKLNLVPNEQYPVGVSFPKEYVQHYDTQPSGLVAFFLQYGPWLLIFGVFAVGAVVLVSVVRKRGYVMPTLSMESLGIRRGLTAVEASYLLAMKPTRIVTEILYSLLQKRAVWVESVSPSIKLRIMEPFEDKKGTRETPLRYYEIDFLNTLKEDGTLDEEKLAGTIMYLRDTVEEKMRGYRRRDTVDYYTSVVTKAWEQVEQAGTPDLASKAYDEQLLWLFLDPNVQTRTQTAFRDMVFQPSPLWLWYWYGYQHYYPHPTYTPNVQTPTQAAKPPTIPGADFANNIATAVENTSNGIVVNLEKFANAILPFQPGEASNEPAHQGADCVCACAACACACACVSCACACAGGGVGLKGDGLKP
jgi:hypothetical protein